MFDTATDLISELLTGAVESLDIPDHLQSAAVREYEHVGNWLAAHADPGGQGWLIYPQGSFRLGTVVLPEGRDHYDLDAVCLRSVDKESTSQVKLKLEVGQVLANYVRAHDDAPGAPTGCEERKRCWTLSYPIAFHLDVLPAIPNPDGTSTAILLTDKKLRAWQHSDPIAYGNWFRAQMEQEFIQKRTRLAEAARTPPEKIPESSVKTTLQRVVQVLKVHRNQFFANDLERRPASILLTTLAARVYRGEQDLTEAVGETVELMQSQVERENGRWLVLNPVEPRENFADKWNEDPSRARLFFAWLAQLDSDLREAQERNSMGIGKVAMRLAESFGAQPIEKAASRLGETLRTERERGRMGFAATSGLLSGAGAMRVKNHDFYGGRRAR
jgi:hypothetical protein